MRLRHFVRACAVSTTLIFAVAAIGPAMAQGSAAPGAAPIGPDMRPAWQENRPYTPQATDPRAREEWLAECRRRISARDDGVGGAVIGGLVGGVAGNRIAGRGNRTVGTIAGAAAGAVVGTAIDKAEDRGRVRDECETYLDDYYAYYGSGGYDRGYPGYGYGYPAYGSGYGPIAAPAYRPAEPECTETVEYVYEDVPLRPRARRIPDKRMKVVPDKRVKTY